MSDPYNPSGYPRNGADPYSAPSAGPAGGSVQPYGQPGQVQPGGAYPSAPSFGDASSASGGYASAPSAAAYGDYQAQSAPAGQQPGFGQGYQQPYQSAYAQPGYQVPGAQGAYQQPGYQVPGAQGGYQQPGYQAGYAGVYPVAAKSKIAAGLLGIFLGGFGVHNFYLGRSNRGVLQLILMIVGILLSFFLFGMFLVLGVEVWTLVEGILILSATPGAVPWGVDERGIPLSS